MSGILVDKQIIEKVSAKLFEVEKNVLDNESQFLRVTNPATLNYTQICSAATSNWKFKFPTAQGATGETLRNDGLGNMFWTTGPPGSVSGVSTGVGLTGGPITTTGTIDLADTAVVAGAYTNANITIDQQGRITTAANGLDMEGVTLVNTGTGLLGGPITVGGTVSLADTSVIPGSYTNANVTIDQQGRVTFAVSGIDAQGVTNVNSGVGLTGGPITGSGTLDLANTAVTPGSYDFTSITVDQQGRITAAASGAPVTQINTGAGIDGGPITTTGTLTLANTTVTPGSYGFCNLTVDQKGRITAAADGVPVTSVATGVGLTGGPITSTGVIDLGDTSVTPGSYTSANITVDQQGRIIAATNGGDSNKGSPGLGVVATELGSAINHLTILDVSGVTAVAIVPGVTSAHGFLIYTFPVGGVVVNSMTMNIAFTATAETTTNTPDVGVGIIVAAGAFATLDLVGPNAEILITGTTAADASGSVTNAFTVPAFTTTVGDSVYLNFSHAWEADVVGPVSFSGTVNLAWTIIP